MLLTLHIPRIEVTVSANGLSKNNKKPSQFQEDLPGHFRYTHAPGLPISRPIGYPHVVDTEYFDADTDIDGLTLGDGIATFLWNWDRNQFHSFFNLSHHKFEIWYKAPDGVIKDMAISRSGRNVMAGFRRAKDKSPGPPEPQVIARMDRNGKWSGRACSEAPHAIEWYSSHFAKTIIYHKLWDLKYWNAQIVIRHDFGDGVDCFK